MTQALLRRACLSAVIGAVMFAPADFASAAKSHGAHHRRGHSHHVFSGSDPLPAVRDLLSSFTQRQAAGYMVDVSLVEGAPPRTWSGPGAFQAWATSLHQAGGADALTSLHGSPRTDHNMAYVLAPVLYSYERRGAVVVEPAAMAISLRRAQGGWEVTGWAWAGANPRTAEQANAASPYLPAG